MYNTKIIYWPILFIMDVIGYILYFWNNMKKRPEQVRKVLFIRLEHIGDMIMTTPVFENFHKKYPYAEIHVLCRELTRPIIEENPTISKIFTYEAPWLIRSQKKDSLNNLIKRLKAENYDLVFEMHGDPRNNRLANNIGAYAIGYGCRGGGFFLNERIRYNPNISMVKQNLELIKPFCDIKTSDTKIYYDTTQDNKVLKKFGLHAKKYIIINPRSGRAEKDLDEKEIKEFIEKSRGNDIIITGSKSEIEQNENIKGKNMTDLTGKTTLKELFTIVRYAKKVYAPDTGIIHIAKALGTEFHALYKTTNKKVWGYTT